MSNETIWRYMSLAKYVDLLRTRSLYFPKASLFGDDSEGKWMSHALTYWDARRWENALKNADMLERLVLDSDQDAERIKVGAEKLLSSGQEFAPILNDVLKEVSRILAVHRIKYLQSLIDSWRKLANKHDQSLGSWRNQVSVVRESTYISCWNWSSSMSLAMWEIYGGGLDAVAIRSTSEKFKQLVAFNSDYLESKGLLGSVAEVQYHDGLMAPSMDLRDQLLDLLQRVGVSETRVAEFVIKPSMYEFERELRGILFPKRGVFDPVVDPHPDLIGVSLKLPGEAHEFIEAVHIHPTLDQDAMMARTLTSLNQSYGASSIKVVANALRPLGAEVEVAKVDHNEK